MKPNWEHAPEWAQWLAKDAGDSWYWYETKPFLGQYCWISTDRYTYVGYDRSPWKESLEKRP